MSNLSHPKYDPVITIPFLVVIAASVSTIFGMSRDSINTSSDINSSTESVNRNHQNNYSSNRSSLSIGSLLIPVIIIGILVSVTIEGVGLIYQQYYFSEMLFLLPVFIAGTITRFFYKADITDAEPSIWLGRIAKLLLLIPLAYSLATKDSLYSELSKQMANPDLYEIIWLTLLFVLYVFIGYIGLLRPAAYSLFFICSATINRVTSKGITGLFNAINLSLLLASLLVATFLYGDNIRIARNFMLDEIAISTAVYLMMLITIWLSANMNCVYDAQETEEEEVWGLFLIVGLWVTTAIAAGMVKIGYKITTQDFLLRLLPYDYYGGEFGYLYLALGSMSALVIAIYYFANIRQKSNEDTFTVVKNSAIPCLFSFVLLAIVNFELWNILVRHYYYS